MADSNHFWMNSFFGIFFSETGGKITIEVQGLYLQLVLNPIEKNLGKSIWNVYNLYFDAGWNYEFFVEFYAIKRWVLIIIEKKFLKDASIIFYGVVWWVLPCRKCGLSPFLINAHSKRQVITTKISFQEACMGEI